MKTKTWTMTAIYTSETFPKGAILIEESAGREKLYTWELRNGSKQPCSKEFVAARKKNWTRRAV